MKKMLLGLALATSFANTAHAQLHRRNSSFAGLKVGGSAATFVGDNAKDMQYVFGFNAGLFAHLTISQPFSIQPELLYSMKGAQTPAGYLTQSTTSLTYIDLPVAIRATTKDGLFAEAGPQVGYLISASSKSDANGEKVNVKKYYNSLDFGLVAGVGYQPSKGGFGVGARYNLGLQNVPKNLADGSPGLDLSNGVFQLYLTYSRPTYHKPKPKTK